MAINTLKEYFAKCQAQSGKGTFGMGWGNGAWGGNTAQSLWYRMQNGVAPTNEVYTSAHANAVLNQDRIPATWPRKLFLAEMEWGAALGNAGYQKNSVMIYDRLVGVAGLSMAAVGEQTTNLPTQPLPRYTDGEEVQIMLECYGRLNGSTSNLFTVRYTNSKGVPNRISQPVWFGTNNNNGDTGNTVMVPLADGDTGVLSVEGVTMTTPNATNSGNFGITLVKFLGFGPVDSQAQIERQAYRNYFNAGALVEVKPDACIGLLLLGASTSTTGHWHLGRIGVISE